MVNKKSNRWTREEHILALNMYVTHGEVSSTEEIVVELSNLLRTLNNPSEYSDSDRSRNPNGVSSKVNSFASLDPASNKFGSDIGALEEEIWEEFSHNETELRHEVLSIVNKAKISKELTPSRINPSAPGIQAVNPISNQESTDHLGRLLEAFRDRLIDLSRRNRLLNFVHSERSNTHIRLVDCGLRNILKSMTSGRPLEFNPLPHYEFEPEDELTDEFKLAYEVAILSDPEYLDSAQKLTLEESSDPDAQAALDRSLRDRVREELGMVSRPNSRTALPSQIAQANGINPSYSLRFDHNPNNQEYVRQIQTLFIEDRMESKLSKLRDTARRFIEETGVNRLYLAVGFIEWYESEHTDRPNFAPLLVIPATIARQTSENRWRYFLNGEGEPLHENIALRIRLADEGIDLPYFDSSKDIEDYFFEVETAIDQKDKWRIHNYATVGTFSFSNIELWDDLKQGNWPDNPLSENENVQKLFGSGGDGSAAMHAEEHDVDDPSVVPLLPPLVLDADSSQLSAIIDAMEGKNLAIKGPPGTGKSQTIANLIAALMFAGKKVLFVAEKMAALEVVKSRLDDVDLGDFILELHSSKAHTINLVRSLSERREFVSPQLDEQQLITKREQLESLKQQLNDYSALLNLPAGRSGKTIHDTLWASQNRHFIFDHPEYKKFEIQNPEGLGLNEFDQNKLSLQQFEEIAKRISDDHGSIIEHPWNWVSNPVDALSRRQLIDQVSAWLDLEKELIEIEHSLESIGVEGKLNTSEIRSSFIEWVTNLPVIQDEIVPELLAILDIDGMDPNIRTLISLVADRDALLDTLSSLHNQRDEIRPNGVVNCHLPKSAEEFKWETFPSSVEEYISSVSNITERLENLKSLAVELNETIDNLSPKLWIESAIPQVELVSNQLLAMPRSIFENDSNGRLDDIRHTPTVIHLLEDQISNVGRIDQTARILCNLFGINEDLNLSDLNYLLDAVELLISASDASLELRSERLLGAHVRSELEELSEQASEILGEQSRLSARFRLESSDIRHTLVNHALTLRTSGFLSRIVSSEFREAKNTWVRLSKNYDTGSNESSSTRFDMAADLLSIVDHHDQVDKFVESATSKNFFDDQFRGLETNFPILIDACTYMNEVQNRWRGGKLGQKVNDVLKKGQIEDLLGIKEWVRSGSLSDLKNLLDQTILSNDAPFIDQIASTQSELDWYKDFQRVIAPIEIVGAITLKEIPTLVPLVRAYMDLSTRMSETTSELSEIEAQRYVFKSSLESMSATLKYSDQIGVSTIGYETWPVNLLFSEHVLENLAELHNARHQISTWIGKEQNLTRQIEPLCRPEFLNEHFKDVNCSIDQTREVFKRSIEYEDDIGTWMRYLESVDECESRNLGQYISVYDHLQEHPPSIAYDALFWHSLAQKLLQRNPILRRFSGRTQENAQEQFRGLDREILDLNQKLIARRLTGYGNTNLVAGRRDGLRNTWTEMSLINVLIPQVRPRPTIRDVLGRAGTSIQSLKRCFMMSPNSVAQFLAPGGVDFDVLIIDEASQMKPEEAIGSVARSRQAIIVGDPMQLPPTSFFTRVDTLDEELEEDVEDESILDRALASYTPYRELRWHYRSRHHDLINFSNQEFYQNRLIVFPSPTSVSESDLGVRYHKVDGTYMGRGGNPEEAKKVAEAAIRAIKERPDWSIGVVAINREQTDLIRTEFDQMLLKDRQARGYWDAWENTLYPGFIKNLENVQGDERDRIIISTVYGPNTQGRVLQQFGPIVSRNGHRRLNVLFTRARQRVDVFSSMSSNDIRIDERSSLGVKAFREYLNYAATLRLAPGYESDRLPDSEFEIYVADALRREGYEVVPQVGVKVGDGRFYIDIGVRHSAYPHGFLAGIECDGASYHSGKSAKDRDRLRQEVLEGLGWDLYRIWSTDWFNDSRGETRKLIQYLESLLELKLASSDDRLTYDLDLDDSGYIQSLDDDTLVDPPTDEEPVESNDNRVEVLPHSVESDLTNHRDIHLEEESNHGSLDSDEIFESPDIVFQPPTIETLTVVEAKNELIDYRERVISKSHPLSPRSSGVLRETMLELLLNIRPTTPKEFLTRVPEIHREQTEQVQIDRHLEHIFSVLKRIV